MESLPNQSTNVAEPSTGQQEDEKRRKEAEKRKKENEKMQEAMTSAKTNYFRAGVCRCWYCCFFHCCLPPIFWLYGLALFALSLYFSLKYTLELKKAKQQLELHLLYWGTVTYASIFILLVQLTYLLVLFESTRKCGIFTFSLLYILTFLICLAVLLLSIFCPEFCPMGDTRRRRILTSRKWRKRIPGQIFILTIAAAVTLGLLVFVLHIYLHNVLQFIEERELKNNAEAYCGDCEKAKTIASPSTLGTTFNSAKQSPSISIKYSTESGLNNNNSNYKPFSEIPRRYRLYNKSMERTTMSNAGRSQIYSSPSHYSYNSRNIYFDQ